MLLVLKRDGYFEHQKHRFKQNDKKINTILCLQQLAFNNNFMPKNLLIWTLVNRYANKYRILGECLLIPSLPGKAFRTHVDIERLAERERMLTSRGLPSDSTCFLNAEPGKLDIKDANLVFYLSVYPLLNTLQTSDYDVIFDFCVDSASLATSFKKCNIIMT